MSDHAPTPSDDPPDPPPEPEGRSGSHTPVSPSPGPPSWTNESDTPEPFDPPAGGRYQAHSFHKPGGMGRVWRARDAELGRDVAFKEIRPRFADDEKIRRRFVFEAEVTGRLEHPAVIPVYGFGHDAAGRPYYAMRFVEGKSLQEAIAEFYSPDGPTGSERAVALRRLLGHFVTVCRAIDYAHSRGVIHRDLKPDNIMVGDFGETLVVDWGIAKRLRAVAGEEVAAPAGPGRPEEPAEQSNSLTGNQIGTRKYWSPEQAAGAPDEHDERTDVYGLGAVLFAILTGTSPNPPNGVHTPDPPSPRKDRPWVDAGIDTITRTALALDRKDRYPTASAVAQAVELWLADQPLLAQRGAVEALSRAADEYPTNLELVEQFARQRSNLGLMLAGMGRDAEAATEFWESANVFARLAHESRQPRFSAEEANCLLAMARALGTLGRAEEAKTAERRAARIFKTLTATQPQVYNKDFEKVMLSASQADIDVSEVEPRADDAATSGSQLVIKLPPDFDAPAPTGSVASAPDVDSGAPAIPVGFLVDSSADIDLGAVPAPPDAKTPAGSRSDFDFLLPDVAYNDLPPIPEPEEADGSAPPPRPAATRGSGASFDDILSGAESIHDLPDPPAAPREEVRTDADIELPPSESPLLVPTDPVIELPPVSSQESVADIGVLYPAKAVGSSFDFELPSGVRSYADLPPVPVPPPEEKPADGASSSSFALSLGTVDGSSGPRPADSVPDIDVLFPVAAPKPPAAPGAFLGLASGYTRVRDLARGGMGRLILARDENLNRLVVIKTLADAADSRAARRFRREVQITGALEHPNLVRAYASGTGDDGRPYMVLEYLNGTTLVSQLDARGPGWTAALLDPLAQACDGIHYAHTRGVVHRDAKLANIIVLPLGRTVLLDWGLGKVIGQQDGLDSGIGAEPLADPGADDPMRSRAGALVGTPAYMAPEQARGDASAIGPRTDVFALGADLFHLVYGHPPGHRYELRELITRRRADDVPRLRDVRPDAPARLDAICARAMAFRPEDRYPTAAALAADIRAFLASQPAGR